MSQDLKTLGDGQIWDLKGVSTHAPLETFEDLFSGRALGRMAREKRKVFSAFKEKGKITGLSVTKALLSKNLKAKNTAKVLLEELAKNAVRGIEILSQGGGFKENWTEKERNYWKNPDLVIIGGGVSKAETGRFLVSCIRRYLSQNGFSRLQIRQAKFPGKEAGFLGAVINIIQLICSAAKKRGLKVIGGIGIDLGREEIGVGLLAVNSSSGKILKHKNQYWLFRSATRTPKRKYLKNFSDTRLGYTQKEEKRGKRIRLIILEQIADLILKAQRQAQKIGLACSKDLGVAVPGTTLPSGFILNSTDYLPFFRKKDGFNFARSLEKILAQKHLPGQKVHIVNDGIAAGMANAYFNHLKTRQQKFAFLGVGSGLGGCVGIRRL